MEQTKGYENKLSALLSAVMSFQQAMAIDLAGHGDIERDTIKSGQAQKFEVCVELFWKTVKKFLYEIHGIESVSPKMVMKQLYRSEYVNEDGYETLIEMVNDRNRLSHIYNDAQFNRIYGRLPAYLHLMNGIMTKIHPIDEKDEKDEKNV